MIVETLYKHFSSHKEGSWIINPQNAQLLYKFVKEHAIKRVLELGTGVGFSTSVISLALKDKGETDYEIHTIEQFEKCHKLAQELIPEELKKNITFHLAEPTIWQTEFIPYQHYSIFKELPAGDFDLWVVDGPGPFVENGKYLELPNGDVMKTLLEDKLKLGTLIAWDGRLMALKDLERYFGDNFYLVQPGNTSDFNVIERKDNVVKFDDMKLNMMKETGYLEKDLPKKDNGK